MGPGRAGSRRLPMEAGQRLLRPWRISLESLALLLAGGCVLKARGWESCSLCLFPFNHTSVCNLRQAGEEKRGWKKKEKGKNSAVIPASASSSLSSPASQEPRHRHPALLRGCSAWRALRETNSNFSPKQREEGPGLGERESTSVEK